MMKKKYALLLAGMLTLSMAAGCGSKTGAVSDTVKQEVQESETVTVAEEPVDVQDTENADAQTDGEEKTITGTVEEIKDFMFIITDETGASYEFSFDTKPEGLDDVTVGDKVQVTYTGEVSEIDAFTGTVISVEKQ